MLDKKLLVCRSFDKYDDVMYRVIDLALPVEICECSAYRIAERNLDALAEAILELMNIDITGDNEISKTMDISTDLVRSIKKSVLYAHSYISDDYKTITDEGKKYLLDGESSEYQNEKVFGNMFVSIPDREVMPYFLEGKLPFSNPRLPREICKLLTNENGEIVQDHAKWTPKFARAYKLFAKISRNSDDESIDEIEFASEEFSDVSYDEVNDAEDEIAIPTNAEPETELLNTYQLIKLLNTENKQTSLKTKIIVNKENPESFILLSPFGKNETNWFTKRLAWLRENNIKISDENGKERTLNEMLQDITDEFYIQFPNLQECDFDYWLSIEYPNLKRIKCQQYLIDSFKGLYNLKKSYDNNQVEATEVIIRSHKLLETILNNYIEKNHNKKVILDKCDAFVAHDSTKVKDIFGSYGISDCVALRYGKWKESLQNFKRSVSKYGSSVADKYFYLTIGAYFSNKTPFKRILEKDGAGFIKDLDYLNRTRNKYGAHSDDVIEKSISKEEFENFNSIATEVMKMLINNPSC
jgi:hypothetical protein